MTDFSQLVPEPGERSLYFGTSRAGKSALMEWTLRHIQVTRPECMSVIVDTKPRFRAEQAIGRFGRRVDASKMYESWEKGPLVPNSVVMDIHREKPFKGLWKEPGEVVIMQSGEEDDWLRMLDLLTAFCKAHIRGRERLMMVDECLDFTNATRWESASEKTFSTALAVLAENAELERCSALTVFMDYRHWYEIWPHVSPFSISQTTRICESFKTAESKTPNRLAGITFSVNGRKNREERSANR